MLFNFGKGKMMEKKNAENSGKIIRKDNFRN